MANIFAGPLTSRDIDPWRRRASSSRPRGLIYVTPKRATPSDDVSREIWTGEDDGASPGWFFDGHAWRLDGEVPTRTRAGAWVVRSCLLAAS